MKKVTRIGLIFFLLLLLIGIRAFIEPFFYDPLINYYKSNYLMNSIPELNLGCYFLNIFFRYSINSIISILIIILVFNNFKTIRFVIKFYAFAFVILSILLLLFLQFEPLSNKFVIFYIRRFLIQPLFLFILLPAFYYQKLKLKDDFKK
jgi:exosortase F-associated protein